MDTCARIQIHYKCLYQFPWTYFVYPHSSFPIHHDTRLYISQIHLCKSKTLPVAFMCSSLLSAFSDPHDTKWCIISLVHLYSHSESWQPVTGKSVSQKHTWHQKTAPSTLPSMSWKIQIDTRRCTCALRGGHWLQTMYLSREVLDLKTPLRALYWYFSQTFDRGAGRNIQADLSSTWG